MIVTRIEYIIMLTEKIDNLTKNYEHLSLQNLYELWEVATDKIEISALATRIILLEHINDFQNKTTFK